MADIKKFLDQAGVSTLWGQVAANLEAEAARAKAAEAEIEANAEIQNEEAVAESEVVSDTTSDEKPAIVEANSTQSFDSFEIPSQETVEEFNIEEASASATAEQENKSSTPSDDLGLPEGFDMSALEGLDDLLKEAGL